jgi:ring-1,2-phenylacetyl-CoA epoxidase subunit PaaC
MTMPDHLYTYTLHLADTALILGHRNSEWCGHGPILEQDIAITNISLDLIGQARNFFQYAADLSGNGATEDSLAYLRDARSYLNLLIAEQPNGDWGKTILRQFLVSNFHSLLYDKLRDSRDTQIAAIAAKALKEVQYHLKWSSEWVIRLGDGTDESHGRMLVAIDELWTYAGEMFIPTPYEQWASENEIAPPLSSLRQPWMNRVLEVFDEGKLPVPSAGFVQSGGKQGIHTEYLGYILAEMQYLQRTYPGAKW